VASTADCKKFIVDFLRDTPEQVVSILTEDGFTDALNVKNWKREWKCKPGGGEGEYDEYRIVQRGSRYNRWGDPHSCKRVPASQFVAERRFDCDPFEGQFAFLVLEDANGDLHFGDYVGD
jgi:hypothetical protein